MAASSVDVELLLDRFLSASTATDCLESLENLQGKFRLRRFPLTKAVISGVHPNSKRPSHEVENLEEERRHAEAEEEERQSIAIDTLLSNASALRALCGLVASSKLPPSRSDTSNNNNSSSYTNGGMEVEGGDVVACELLSMLLLSSAARPTNNAGAANVAGGTTTEALQKQQRQQRRVEYIAKTMLTFHYTFENGDSVADSVPALTPALLDCLCASPSLLSSNSDVTTSSVGVPPPSVYARVLTLQILQSLLLASPGTLREQLMMAPDGVNRLVDLLGHGPSAMGGGNDVGDEDDRNSVPEEVRNESILFLTSLATSSSMLARLITFSEGYDRSLKIALESSSSSTSSSSSSGGSGLSSGTTVPIDCLDLCLALAHGDEVARELFMGGGDGRGNLDRLAQLMDLRGTERYCNAERNAWWAKELKEKRYKEKNTESAVKEVVKGKEEPVLTDSTIRKGGKRGKKSKDDLDDILSGASSSSSSSTPDVKKYHAVVQTASESEQKKAIAREPDDPPTPFLTPNESSIVDSVFNLILVLLRDGDENTPSTKTNRSKRRGRAKSIMSHNLVRYIVDCALYTLPPPGVDYVSGVPSPALQQKALVTMGVLGSLGDTVIFEEESTKTSHKDSDKARAAMRKKEVNEECEIQTKLLFETMPIYLQGYVTAIDRLMYLCCTGAYSPIIPTDDNVYNDDERPEVISSLLSTYSISTFRSCLSSETASRMVLHSLAPPPPDETDEMGSPLEPPVVTRLVTTLVDNLRFLQSRQQHHDGKSEGEILDLNEVFRATIGASGSAGALGVFLTNGEGDATREMLLRLSPPPSTINLELEQSSNNMIDFILQHVATYDPDSTSNISLHHASSAYITVVLFKLLSEWVFGMPRAVMALLSSPSSVSLGVLLRSKKGGESNSEAVPALCGLLLGLCLEYMTDPDDGGASGSSISNDASEFDNIAWNRDTIMKMIQSMGVGKYLSMIDELKIRPLPLPYCNGEARSIIERRAFSSWYGHNVTLIRRHVVMALAGNREDDSDESDADGPDGPNKSTSSVRSLRKMVSNQAQEIENLQTKLEDALLTITSQSMHIKELKRVTELGNSAETVDMMTEYSEKMAELEQMKKELRIDAKTQTKLRMQTIAAKDNEIAVLQNELSESQTCVEEVRRDNDTLREEMSGLSSAYNSLELQYRRTRSSSSTFVPSEQTAGGEAAFEHGVTSNSSAGENAVEQFASKYLGEVQFLREENARLREEGRAANEWMSMAVSKMEEMSGDNEALAQSLDDATSNLASTGSESDSQSIQNHMELLRVREEAETKLKAKADEIANQQALVQQLKDRIVEMNENKDESSDQELKELQQVITRQEGELESLRQASREAQEWMATAVTHVETLTKEVQDKEKLLKLQGKSEDDSNELEDKLAELENSLESVTSELSESQKAQEAFSMEISALKAENADRLVRVGDMHSNDASKIGALAAELDQVKQEKITLEDLMNQFRSRSEEAQSQLVEVETKLNEATSQRDNLMNRVESFATLADNHSDSHDYKEEIKALQVEHREKIQELERMQNQILQDADDNDARVDKVLQDIEAEKQRAEVLSQENTNLSAMIEELSLDKKHLSSTLSAQLRSAQGQLAEYEAKVNDLTYERDGLILRLESNLSVDNESIHLIQSLRQELDVKNEQLVQIQDQLIDDAEESEVKLNQLVHDLDAEKQRAEGLSQDKAGLSSMIEKLSIETDHISRVISEKQALLDSINASKNDADMLAEESQRRVSELEQVLNVSTAQLHKFALLQDQINSITAERDEIKSQLTLLIEEYELASMSYQANQSLQNQISELMEKSTQQDSEKDTLQNALDEVMEAAEQWQQRTQSLESAVTSLEYQLEQQENEAAEAIALWESRCMTLEETGGDVIRQWEEKVQTLESDVSILENKVTQQEMEATDAIAQWEARFSALGVNEGAVVRQCEERVRSLEAQLQTKEDETSESKSKVSQAEQSLTAAKDEINVLSKQIVALKSSVAMMTPQIDILNKQIDEKSKAIENMQLYIDDKDVELADLATELQETHIDKQWQERSEQLEAQVTELENTIKETKTRSEENVRLCQERAESQEKEATDAIAQWDIRCATLTERIVTLELEFAAADADTSVVTLKAEMRENETRPAATVEELEIKCSDYQKRIDEYAADIDRVKSMCSVLQEVRNTAVKEKEESEIIALELKDELRHTNEQLQSYATDQFAKKATDMATQALREQMQQIRARYSADQDALRSEREARLSADEEVERLKSDLALLAQATEFDDDVDVHVRKMAKKMTAENVKAEREEMAQLRTTLERLREELGSCRWNERQSEDNAANARLHTSILEQEVSATKKDLQLLEQALEELESSKIDMIVSFEYRIEVLENDRPWIERSHEEEMLGIKKELMESNEERDKFAYKLELCEKNNTVLVYSTAHEEPGGKESESRLVKLQLERAQLLSKINEMGINLERRVREAVAAQVSSSEAELIVEKQSRHLVETSLSEAMTELDNVKKQLSDFVSKDGNGDDQLTQVLEESLDDLRNKNEKQLDRNKVLQLKVETIDKENMSTISDLRDKLQSAQEELRAHERESRFEAALAAEINHLRASSHTASVSTLSQALVCLDQNLQSHTWLDEGKESIDRNSAYVIEMYDYVCELKSSIVEERQMYKDLLAEHEDLLALLGQAGIEGIQ